MTHAIKKNGLYMGDKKGLQYEWVPLEQIEKIKFMPFITASQMSMAKDAKVVSAKEMLTEYIREHQK